MFNENVLPVHNLGPEHYSSIRSLIFFEESVSCLSVENVATFPRKRLHNLGPEHNSSIRMEKFVKESVLCFFVTVIEETGTVNVERFFFFIAISASYVSCRCRAGFSGSGFGADGCTAAGGGGDGDAPAGDVCAPNPCLNGGVCSPAAGGGVGFTCRCRAGYDGPVCQLAAADPCAPSPCLNGATCTVVGADRQVRCLCPAGFAGDRCHLQVLGNSQSQVRKPNLTEPYLT